jgi:hypothetical protein
VLHQMCQKLDMKKFPYFVGTLQIGDYVSRPKTAERRLGGPWTIYALLLSSESRSKMSP